MPVDFASLFGFDPEEKKKGASFDVPFTPQAEPDADDMILGSWAEAKERLERIEEERKEAYAEAEGLGLLARYPKADTDEKRETLAASYRAKGWSEDRIKKQMDKLAKKGGKVKTSAKLGMAATLLSKGLQGWLAVAGRAPWPNQTGMQAMQAQQQARVDEAKAVADRKAGLDTKLVQAMTDEQMKLRATDAENRERRRSQLLGVLYRNPEVAALIQPGMDIPELLALSSPILSDQVTEAEAKVDQRIAMAERELMIKTAAQNRLEAKERMNATTELYDASALTAQDIAAIRPVNPFDTEAVEAARAEIQQTLDWKREMVETAKLQDIEMRNARYTKLLEQIEADAQKRGPGAVSEAATIVDTAISAALARYQMVEGKSEEVQKWAISKTGGDIRQDPRVAARYMANSGGEILGQATPEGQLAIFQKWVSTAQQTLYPGDKAKQDQFVKALLQEFAARQIQILPQE
jgi:hypothetical protein